MGNQDQALATAKFDLAVRHYVYDSILRRGPIPLAEQIAQGLGCDVEEARASFRRMKEAHILVLQEGDREILMANPFSAVPTPFVVEVGNKRWWGNCIWDALGIVAMTKRDGRISAACGDCNDAIAVLIEAGKARFADGQGIIHFAVPANRWWANIKYT